MTTYKNITIDGTIFTSKASVDAFLKQQAIEAYKTAVELFNSNPDMERGLYADQKAEELVTKFGYTWEQVEAIA